MGKSIRKNFLLEIKEKIERKKQTNPREGFTYWIGIKRQKKVAEALKWLKNKRIIRDFLETEEMTYPDLIKGIDFYICVVKDRYEVYCLSVTGERWVAKHQKRHPENSVIAVDLCESQTSIRQKILGVIQHKL